MPHHKQPMEAKKHVPKSWHGRLTAQADSATASLLASLDVDAALWRYDIAGSLAHAQMLREQGLLTAAELAKIQRGLRAVEEDLASGRLPLPVELEDIHMVIEAELIRRIGDAGRKLHTGRSRNDQVALDLRLWARDAVDDLSAGIRRLQQAFVSLADRKGAAVFPAYTHLQRAQPIVLGHLLLAYVEMLQRDADRLAEARVRINVCPLGAGAAAGTSLPLNRARTAQLLGFPRYARNSLDAVSDRDFLVELCFACCLLATHLSRWAEDWILYSTSEFALLELHDAYCTSSSMMPQKKNADTLELIRGKSAACLAQLTGLLALLKGLPLAYNRDLQDDKRFALPAVETMKQVLAVAPGIVRTAILKTPDLSKGFLDATALAEYLTVRGVPFRTAHGIVGRIVADAERRGRTLADFTPAELRKYSPKIGKDVHRYLGAENVVKRYLPDGAGGANQLARQLRYWQNRLK